MVNTTGFLSTIKDEVKATVVSNATHMAVGLSGAAATVGDTALGDEVTRKAIQEVTQGTNDVIISMFLNSTESNGNDLKEVGMFDAGAAGNLLERNTFTTVSKSSSLEMWIDIEEQIDVTQ